mgnify:CR=1 FL=1
MTTKICIPILLIATLFASDINLNGKTTVEFQKISNQSLNVKIQLGDIEFEQIEKNNQNYIIIKTDINHTTNEPGYPELPQINNLIEIPYETNSRIEIVTENEEIYNLGDFNLDGVILPRQPSVSKSVNIHDVPFTINNEAYSNNAFINSQIAEIDEKGLLRAVRFGNLKINPIAYNPMTKELKIKKEIELNIIFDNANYTLTETEKARLYSPYFEPIYKQFVNYEPLNTRNDLIQDEVTYLIIANSIFTNDLDEFVDWKTQKGFNVELVYDTDIGGASAETVRSYIMSRYNSSSPPSFVLIVGDEPQIAASYENNSEGHVSDLNYASMGNDGIDGIPDILIGRFSAQNDSQLESQIQKTLEYEKFEMSDPSFLEEVVMISGVDANMAATYGNGQINYGNQYYFNSSHGIYSNTILYPESDEGWAAQQILDWANEGAAFINYTAHGWESGWDDPRFDVNDANAMTNAGKYPTMIGNCCTTNKFDYGGGPCFGEALLRKSNGGAIGYIGGSNVTYWNEDFWWGVGNASISANPTYNNSGEGAYDGMFHENQEENWAIVNGAIIYLGNLAVVEAGGSLVQYYWEIYHLMGDPSVSTYLGMPLTNDVSHDVFTPLGTDAIEIQANPQSYVGISQDGQLLGSGTVDDSGFLVIVFDNPPSNAGILDVVVTAQNTQPYFGEILISSPDGPYVTVTNVDVDFGQDNIVSPGETINVTVNLENVGNQNSSQVAVSLSSDDSYVSIIDGYQTLSTISDGTSSAVQLSFNVANNAPFAYSFSVDLEMNSGDNTWSSSVDFSLAALLESFEVAGFDNLDWELSGNGLWSIEANPLNVFTGGYSARSGLNTDITTNNPGDNTLSDLEITMDVIQDGSISFYKKVSCEAQGNQWYDYLTFYIDDVEQDRWAGEVPWSQNSYNVTEGEHTFKWSFTKDEDSSDNIPSGQDAVWIDNIQFPPIASFGSGVLGDVNGDAQVNIQDIILTVNMILEVIETSYLADLNNNNVVNVADIIIIVNIILN